MANFGESRQFARLTRRFLKPEATNFGILFCYSQGGSSVSSIKKFKVRGNDLEEKIRNGIGDISLYHTLLRRVNSENPIYQFTVKGYCF